MVRSERQATHEIPIRIVLAKHCAYVKINTRCQHKGHSQYTVASPCLSINNSMCQKTFVVVGHLDDNATSSRFILFYFFSFSYNIL